MRDFLKSYFIEIIVVIGFVLFLFAIPKFLTSDGKIEYALESPVIQENQTTGKILEITKFQVISDAVISDFVDTKVEDSNSKVAIDLIVQNKINNKQNSLAQEIISLYQRKEFADVKNLADEIIETRLEKYDKAQDRKWRNEALYIFHDNETYLIYENINLIKKIENSEIVGFTKTTVKPYAYQKYHFTFTNGTVEVVTVDLKTKKADKDLGQFIDIETGKPKMEFKDLKIEFVESSDEYIVEFVVWK